MTTSGTTSFSQTALQAITDAYQILGVYGSGDTVGTNDVNLAINLLEKMLKAWEAKGIHLWTEQEGGLFLTLNQQKYSLSSTSTDIAGDDPVFTSLTASGSGSSLTVGSTTGMNVNDKIGVVLDNATIQWSTIQSIGSSTSVTMNDSLTSSSSSGNNVFAFTNRTDRPLSFTSTRFRTADGTERPIELVGRTAFMSLPNKAFTGPANQIYYSPKVSDSTMYVWPTADDVNCCILFSYLRRIQDVGASGNTLDIPQEWLECVTYNLAIRLSGPNGIDVIKRDPDIKLLADKSLLEMQLWDAEESSVIIAPKERFD